jgi:hypothetical protein
VANTPNSFRNGAVGFIDWLGLRLATNSGPTLGVPIRQWLLETGSAQVVGNTDQVFLRIFYTLIVTERPNLMENIRVEGPRLSFAQFNVQFLAEKAYQGLDYFGLLFLGQWDRHYTGLTR